ncbi:hypothetical protein [Photobacterium leiognathi]|uniref:hypothetical protein n=1 Tax=Photobacterium leiognathi TaxID=553611 RepID=UPI0029827290|nr:hypothetical protein [Photobacterium leiognathi]
MQHKNVIFTTIQNQFNSTIDRTNKAVDHLATNYANAKGLQIADFWENHGKQFQTDFDSLFAQAHNASFSSPNLNDEQKLSAFEKQMALLF